MNWVNDRTKDLKQGAIRAMFDRANRMTGVISMGIGEPDMPTPRPVCEALEEALRTGYTHYSSNQGILPLRQAIAERTSLKDAGFDPETEIIITNGGMGALSLLMAVIINPGDEVLIQDPQWLNYVAQVNYYGGVPVRVPTRAEDDFEMQPEVIESLITEKTKALMINTPNNPTGHVMSEESLKAIARLAVKYDLLVIADEVYSTLVYDGAKARSIALLPGMKERSVTVNSMSKAFAMTGWRIGYAAGPAAIIDKMVKCQENFNACANTPCQHAAVFAYAHPELCEELRLVFERRRKLLMEMLPQIPGIRLRAPQGAFYAFPSVKALCEDDTLFCERLLTEAKVVCIPGSAFGACGRGHIRIAYTTGEDRLREGLERLAVFCETLKKEG